MCVFCTQLLLSAHNTLCNDGIFIKKDRANPNQIHLGNLIGLNIIDSEKNLEFIGK